MSSSLSSRILEPSDVAQDPNIMPVPYNESDSLRDRTDEYFWSKDLPADNIVCTVGDGTDSITTSQCCPPAIGIYSPNGGCRMSNTAQNSAYFHNCTLQLSLEEKPNTTAARVNATCVPFETYLNVTREQRRDEIERRTYDTLKGKARTFMQSVPVCSSVGWPERFNYTGKCCDKLGGDHTMTQGGVLKSVRSAHSLMDCYSPKNDSKFPAKFTQCLDDFGTWAVCAESRWKTDNGETDSSSAPDTTMTRMGPGMLVAGAALALLV